MRKVLLSGAARTAIGDLNGALSGVGAVQLGVVAASTALERSGLSGDKVEEAVFGNGPPQERSLTQQVRLTYEFVEGARPHALGEGTRIVVGDGEGQRRSFRTPFARSTISSRDVTLSPGVGEENRSQASGERVRFR